MVGFATVPVKLADAGPGVAVKPAGKASAGTARASRTGSTAPDCTVKATCGWVKSKIVPDAAKR